MPDSEDGYLLLGWSEVNAYDGAGARSRITLGFYRCEACSASVACSGPNEKALNSSPLWEHRAWHERAGQ